MRGLCLCLRPTLARGSGVPAEIEHHFELARSLSMETVLLYGRDVAEALVKFARERQVTQLFLGRAVHAGWREYFRRNVIERILRDAPNVDVHVVADR